MTGRRKPGPHNQGGGTAAGGGPVSAGRTTRTGSAGIRVAAAADLGAPFSAPQLVTATTRWSALAVTPLRQAPSSRSGFVKPREFGISNRCASRGGQAGRFPARRPPTGAEPLFPQGAPQTGRLGRSSGQEALGEEERRAIQGLVGFVQEACEALEACSRITARRPPIAASASRRP